MRNEFHGNVGQVVQIEARGGTVNVDNHAMLGPESSIEDFNRLLAGAETLLRDIGPLDEGQRKSVSSALLLAQTESKQPNPSGSRIGQAMEHASQLLSRADNFTSEVVKLTSLLASLGGWAIAHFV